MNLKLLFIIAISVFIAAGCTKIVPINSTLPVNVTLTSNDLAIGTIVTHTIPYNEKDPHIYAKLYKEALTVSGYDFILLPQYNITKSLFKKYISINGYGASIKRK